MRKRKRRGLRPTKDTVRNKLALGYALPAELARAFSIAPTTIYGWVKNDKLTSPDSSKPVSYKEMGNLWVLIAAVEAKVGHVPRTAAS
jgi:hypothetical protein